jgi:DNA-binding transcriptional MerR regulator
MDKSAEAFRTISEAAEELHVPQHVLRFWETRFTHIKPMKRAGGRRYYRPEDMALLHAIRHLLYGEGYTIRGVQRILKEQGIKAVLAMPAASSSQKRAVRVGDVPVVSIDGDERTSFAQRRVREDDEPPVHKEPVFDVRVAESDDEHEELDRIADVYGVEHNDDLYADESSVHAAAEADDHFYPDEVLAPVPSFVPEPMAAPAHMPPAAPAYVPEPTSAHASAPVHAAYARGALPQFAHLRPTSAAAPALSPTQIAHLRAVLADLEECERLLAQAHAHLA